MQSNAIGRPRLDAAPKARRHCFCGPMGLLTRLTLRRRPDAPMIRADLTPAAPARRNSYV